MVDLLCIGFTRLYTTKNHTISYYTICGGMPLIIDPDFLKLWRQRGATFPEFLLDFKLTGTLEGSDHVTISQQCPERWKMMKMEVLDFFPDMFWLKRKNRYFSQDMVDQKDWMKPLEGDEEAMALPSSTHNMIRVQEHCHCLICMSLIVCSLVRSISLDRCHFASLLHHLSHACWDGDDVLSCWKNDHWT